MAAHPLASSLPTRLVVTDRALAPAVASGAAAAAANANDARGDTRAAERSERIERLVRDHHAFAWRSVRRLGVREADLDDVVQEVFLTVSKNLDDVQPERERGYVFRTCVFLAAHARRSVQRRREVVDEARLGEEIDRRPSPEQSAVASQARERLQSILNEMSKELRAVFVLFELERMTMAEIADVLAVPPGTVASRLRRAREIFVAQAANTGERREGDAR